MSLSIQRNKTLSNRKPSFNLVGWNWGCASKRSPWVPKPRWSGKKMVSSCPKDHQGPSKVWIFWGIYLPLRHTGFSTLSLEGPISLGWEETKLMLQKSGVHQLSLVVIYYFSPRISSFNSMWWFQILFINLSLFVPPYPEEWSNLTNIFQLDWNHQLATQMTTVEKDVFEKRKLNRCDMCLQLWGLCLDRFLFVTHHCNNSIANSLLARACFLHRLSNISTS